MSRQEAIFYIKELQKTYASMDRKVAEAVNIAIKALQGDMYCPSCGVRLVPENEYVEPKPCEAESEVEE